MTEPAPFARACIIGVGLIGSSLARALRQHRLADRIVGADRSADVCATARELGVVDEAGTDLAAMAAGADLVVICAPVGAYGEIAGTIAPALAAGAILTDVGSVKQAAIRAIEPHVPAGVHFIAAHPVAGTENSGPAAGFAELFKGRWCIVTPTAATDPAALARLSAAWTAMGSTVATMSAEHHDRVLAITSHLPHLIAYTIVGTATDLEEHLQAEVIKYSAGGFRDFTRIAASDPIMWRDVFLNNREAVLEMLGRLHEDIAILQRAIRVGDGKTLETLFTKTRAIRRGIIQAHQA